MTAISAIELSGDNAFHSIKNEWQSIFAGSECSPFLSWEWMSTWFQHFGGGKTPCLIKVLQEGRTLGVLPMMRDKTTRLGIRTERLSLMGDGPGGADHLDMICRPRDREKAFSAAISHISREDIADVICFRNLTSDSPAVGIGNEDNSPILSERSKISRTVAAVCPQIDVSNGWEAVLSGCKRASNFKRRLKQLEKMPDFRFRSITDPSDVMPAFERFLHLHQQRWDKAGGSELSGHPRLVRFQEDVVRRMAEAGLVRFDELWLDGECRSSVYGLENGATFYYYNSGYDLEYANKSVGLVLLGLSVRNAIERGVLLFDFLRGDESYKFDWANRSEEIMNVTLSRKSPAMWASLAVETVLAGVKNLGRSALPANAASALANKRRAWKRNLQFSGQ